MRVRECEIDCVCGCVCMLRWLRGVVGAITVLLSFPLHTCICACVRVCVCVCVCERDCVRVRECETDCVCMCVCVVVRVAVAAWCAGAIIVLFSLSPTPIYVRGCVSVWVCWCM